jgi:hypothetical protein
MITPMGKADPSSGGTIRRDTCEQRDSAKHGRYRVGMDRRGRRFRIAAAVTFVAFLACFWALVLGAGQGLLW